MTDKTDRESELKRLKMQRSIAYTHLALGTHLVIGISPYQYERRMMDVIDKIDAKIEQLQNQDNGQE